MPLPFKFAKRYLEMIKECPMKTSPEMEMEVPMYERRKTRILQLRILY
jgi:hypothetical protein